MTTVSYMRSGGARTGIPEGEWLSIDGDTFQAWRATGASAAGHFAGSLTTEEAGRLGAALAACEAAEPAHPPVPRPGATTVQIAVGSVTVTYGSGAPPPGPWTKLDEALHELCDAIVDRPTSAIGIEATDGGARLVHLGSDPIAVDLSDGTFVAIAYSGWYHEEGRSEGALDGGSATAEPGWSAPIPIGELPDRGAGGDDVKVHVIARFTIGAGRDATQAEVAHTPGLDRPS